MSNRGLLPEWEMASSNNLPSVDMLAVANFLKKDDRFNQPEVRGVKANSAGRENYGDTAIGYVQLIREGYFCMVRGRVCPEHKVRTKAYSVQVKVNEKEEQVVDISCDDCAAAAGGCKHALAMLMWLHRRTEEPSPTSVTCYWSKPKLSEVGGSLKFLKVEDMAGTSRHPPQDNTDAESFFQKVMGIAANKQLDSQISRHYFSVSALQELSLHSVAVEYRAREPNEPFENFVKGKYTDKLLRLCEEETRGQCNSEAWHELRYGRVTASKLYEVAHCKTPEGSLVQGILGCRKVKDTKAMARGRRLECEVKSKVEVLLNKKIKSCGLQLVKDHPAIGASPDGLIDDSVVEIKCPSSERTKKNYINCGEIMEKYKAQIHCQMMAANKGKGLFCIADPNFENTKDVEIIEINFDELYILELFQKAELFWRNVILPKILISCELN